MKILVVGDSCLDTFIYGDIERIAPEAPVPVIKPKYKKERAAKNKAFKRKVAKGLKIAADVITGGAISTIELAKLAKKLEAEKKRKKLLKESI